MPRVLVHNGGLNRRLDDLTRRFPETYAAS
jgi:hypothetical protein